MAHPFPSNLLTRLAIATYFVFAAYLGLCGNAYAQNPAAQPIVLNMSTNGFAPYTYFDPDQTPRGIVYDVTSRVFKKLGYNLVTTEIPRKRVERQMLEGNLDATPRAIEWTDHASDFVFSDPIISVRSALVVRADSNYATVESLFGHPIGTRRGYIYTVLTHELESGQLIRSDTNSDLSMLEMLRAKRIEAVLIDEVIARWLFQREGFTDLRVLPATVDNGVQLRLMFTPRHRALVKDFNRELAHLKRSGELAAITARYIGR
jgi:polar amino acid transport system substrate-binding protein